MNNFIMKKNILNLIFFVIPFLFSFSYNATILPENEKICFVLRGNQKTHIEIGIGKEINKGACCSGVSKFSYVSFCGNVGDVVYDSKSRRVLMKISKDFKGKTIELKDYY
jgi:hypothetical protein